MCLFFSGKSAHLLFHMCLCACVRVSCVCVCVFVGTFATAEVVFYGGPLSCGFNPILVVSHSTIKLQADF